MENLGMYEKRRSDGGPVEYAFGPEWVAMALYMDDAGSPSEDAAVLSWYFNIFKKRNNGYSYVPTNQDAEVEAWVKAHNGDEAKAVLDWYYKFYRRECYGNARSDNEGATPTDSSPSDG